MSKNLNHLKRKFNKMILDDRFVTPRRESSNLRVIEEHSRQQFQKLQQQLQQKKKTLKNTISNQTSIQNQHASNLSNSTTTNIQQRTNLRNKKRDLVSNF
jgi:hypothetical protein